MCKGGDNTTTREIIKTRKENERGKWSRDLTRSIKITICSADKVDVEDGRGDKSKKDAFVIHQRRRRKVAMSTGRQNVKGERKEEKSKYTQRESKHQKIEEKNG